MRHVFISPHLDDVALSAGSYLLQLKKNNKNIFAVSVFTHFGKEPLSQFGRTYLKNCGFSHLSEFAKQRLKEDIEAMKFLKARYKHLGFTDAAFRKKVNSFLYPKYERICCRKIPRNENKLVNRIYLSLKKVIKNNDIIYGPLGVGNHVDHLIINKVIQRFPNKKYYWVDQPYFLSVKRKQFLAVAANLKKVFVINKNPQKDKLVNFYTSQVRCLFSGKVNLPKEIFFQKKTKICLVTSRGGHLYQLYILKDWWSRFDRFWITAQGMDVDYLLMGEKIYYGYFPESRHIINAVRNFFLGLRILKKERPDLLFSCGAGIAPPIFLAGKILGCKLVFMEPYDFVAYPSLSGRLIAPIVDKLLVQHKIQKKFYEARLTGKKAKYWGSTL